MKKLLTIILILAMILPAAAMADLPNISNLTDGELIDLISLIQLKLFSSKMIDGVNVPAGVYTVDVDIPEGAYTIKYVPPFETAFCSFFLREEDGGSYSTLLGYGGSSEIGKIFLKKGATIWIDGGDLIFYAYSGLFN